MADPLASIPALVPTPAASLPSRPQSGGIPRDAVEEDDRFASLFSPPTFHNLPPHAPPPGIFAAHPPTSPQSPIRPRRHGRQPSEADFGAFVSVPAAQDPLSEAENASHPQSSEIAATFVQDPSFEFFESFGETAKQTSEENRRSVLEELLAHEDDPLYFLESRADVLNVPISRGSANAAAAQDAAASLPMSSERGVAAEGATTPAPSNQQTQVDEPSLLDRSMDLMFGGDTSSTWAGGASSVLDPAMEDPIFGKPAFSPSETPATDMLAEALSTTHVTVPAVDVPSKGIPSKSSSYPFTPSRSSTFASRWMPSLRTGRSGSTSSTDSPSAPASLAGTLSRSVASAFAGVVAPGQSTESPFGPHTFQPPSGAPGYAGEHPHTVMSRSAPFEFQSDDAQDRRAVLLEGRKPSTDPVLAPELATQLRSHLPALPRLARRWDLLYSLDQHGISLRTLYARCSEPTRKGGSRPALLVVRDASGDSFGAFVGEGIRPSPGNYYGGGESFLWSADGNVTHVFRWTGRNDYVALCDTDSISFGGGDGHYGLYLDDALQDGTSAPCPTFNNEPLCRGVASSAKAKSIPFECVGVEVWAIGT